MVIKFFDISIRRMLGKLTLVETNKIKFNKIRKKAEDWADRHGFRYIDSSCCITLISHNSDYAANIVMKDSDIVYGLVELSLVKFNNDLAGDEGKKLVDKKTDLNNIILSKFLSSLNKACNIDTEETL